MIEESTIKIVANNNCSMLSYQSSLSQYVIQISKSEQIIIVQCFFLQHCSHVKVVKSSTFSAAKINVSLLPPRPSPPSHGCHWYFDVSICTARPENVWKCVTNFRVFSTVDFPLELQLWDRICKRVSVTWMKSHRKKTW